MKKYNYAMYRSLKETPICGRYSLRWSMLDADAYAQEYNAPILVMEIETQKLLAKVFPSGSILIF